MNSTDIANDIRDTRVAIIGGGQAAAAVVRALRIEGHRGSIVLLGAERFGPYERPPLSKGILDGTTTPDATLLLDAERLSELAVETHFGVTVTQVDCHRHLIYLDNGATLSYDKVVIATGGRPRRLKIAGSACDEIAYLRTIDDAIELRDRMHESKRLLIIGGGWIGLEIASSARRLGLHVLVVEAGLRLCERTVPREISGLLLEAHRAHGVEVRLSDEVVRLDQTNDGALLALFGGGTTETFDLVVAGVGMLPNDDLAVAAGLTCKNGVLCDHAGRTSDPAVFACGDVATFVHPLGPPYARRLESWDNAEQQGAACARAILGKGTNTSSLPWFWSEQGMLNLQILGFPDDSRAPIVRRDGEKIIFFWTIDHKIASAVSINSPSDMLAIKRLCYGNVRVTPDQLVDPTVSLKGLLRSNQLGTSPPQTVL